MKTLDTCLNVKKEDCTVETGCIWDEDKKKCNTDKNIIPDDDKKTNKLETIKTFVIYVLILLIGYKVYFFNLNLEYYYKNVEKDGKRFILTGGADENEISERTFGNFFGDEVNNYLMNDLKRENENWFTDYVFNIKIDFSYYFLKFMNILNKSKLTRYFLPSLLFGGPIFGGIMFLMAFIIAFFAVYGLIRVFTMELPYYIFAAMTPFILLHFISIITIIYYTYKMLFLNTEYPFNHTKGNKGFLNLSREKIVILCLIILYFLIRPLISPQDDSDSTNLLISTIFSVLFTIYPFVHLFAYDFMFIKDRHKIWDIFKKNRENIILSAAFIVCILTFYFL